MVQLARALAKSGMQVDYTFCPSQTTTPEGSVKARAEDAATLKLCPLHLSSSLDKYSLLRRRRQEMEYGDIAAKFVLQERPDAVVSANTPLDAQQRIWKAAGRVGAKRVFWLQDIIGVATDRILSRKIPVLGRIIGKHYMRMEKRLLRASDQVIVISPAFRDCIMSWGVREERIHVIPNWTPLDEVVPGSKQNPWSMQRGLSEKFVFLYSGTLSLKHNPGLLFDLARGVKNHGAVVLVRSQGKGADWLKAKLLEEPLPNLRVEGYGPYEELSDALASADVLVAVLEPDAAEFSVPSKVLTYLAAARPIMMAVPKHNLAARKVMENDAGLVSEPDCPATLVDNAVRLIEDAELRAQFGTNARKVAESEFRIDRISNAFQRVIQS